MLRSPLLVFGGPCGAGIKLGPAACHALHALGPVNYHWPCIFFFPGDCGIRYFQSGAQEVGAT